MKINPILRPLLVAGAALPLLAGCATIQSMYSSYFKPSKVEPPVSVVVNSPQSQFVPLEENQRIWRESIARAAAPVAADMTPVQEKEQTTAAVVAAQGGVALRMDTSFASAKRIVPFGFATNGLGPNGKRALKEMAKVAKDADRVYVRGRTDSSGDPLKNIELAKARAAAVQTTFVVNGIPKDKVQASYCTTCFIATNDTEEGRRLNRRVDIELIMPAAKVAALPKGQYDTVQLAAIPLQNLKTAHRLAITPSTSNHVMLVSGEVVQAF